MAHIAFVGLSIEVCQSNDHVSSWDSHSSAITGPLATPLKFRNDMYPSPSKQSTNSTTEEISSVILAPL